MQVKLFEIRDRMTFIPVMAIRSSSRDEAERFLMSSAGYGLTEADHASYYFVIKLPDGEATCRIDPHGWGNSRTMYSAHIYIQTNWEQLESGDVIDIEFALGETTTKKQSERFT